MTNFSQQYEKIKSQSGFIAALDQSGGSTPKALANYGIGTDAFSNDEEMYAVVHQMRSRIGTSPSFNGDRILGAILFENNVSLAAAAYNAGPLNVRNWLPQEDLMPADLWVETVPFDETRNYVQSVLAYATVFDKSLGRDTLISSRMHDIKSEY